MKCPHCKEVIKTGELICSFKDCRAGICQLCPMCGRKREWAEWLIDLTDSKTGMPKVAVQQYLVCPANCVRTSYGSDIEKIMKNWCDICKKIRKKS